MPTRVGNRPGICLASRGRMPQGLTNRRASSSANMPTCRTTNERLNKMLPLPSSLKMAKPVTTDHRIPSPELSHTYTIAMHFAQQFELNLRAFLYIADYHAFIDIPLSDEQKARYKTFDGFIDASTCGTLLKNLRAALAVKDKKLWAALDRACEHRNRLAHSFLTEPNFDHLSSADERALIRELQSMTHDIYLALLFSRAIRHRVENDSDAAHETLKTTMALLGVPDHENADRKYVPVKKRKSKKPGSAHHPSQAIPRVS